MRLIKKTSGMQFDHSVLSTTLLAGCKLHKAQQDPYVGALLASSRHYDFILTAPAQRFVWPATLELIQSVKLPTQSDIDQSLL